jgi:hypothetical protein
MPTPVPVPRAVRVMVAALAGEMAILGLPASLAPRWFHDWFPFGRGWVASTGPYNEHSVVDFGVVAVGLSLVLGWAAIRPTPELCRAVLVGTLGVNLAHLLFHLAHPAELGRIDTVVQDGLLVLAVLVNAAALVLISRLRAASGEGSEPAET